MSKSDFLERFTYNWKHKWIFTLKRVSSATNWRTLIPCIVPKLPISYTLYCIFPDNKYSIALQCCLFAAFSSIICDYSIRHKTGQPSLPLWCIQQIPIPAPESYTQEDIKFISDRVLELVYTAWDMQPFAQDMGYDGEPFIWDNQRRALLRAELDAYYAKLYGLTRDELRYILDPSDVYGPDFPSETFRVLKNNETKKYGEYRTQRLVLAAWDMLGF
jgi:hypothetical protein